MPRVPRRKLNSRPSAKGRNASRAKMQPLDVDDAWISDPKLVGLVKSQVEDVDLITQRRTQFVRTAITLFSRKGYHATTVKEIAEAAGVSPGLIYQYVTDKEDILFLALQLIVHTNKRALPAAMDTVAHPVHKFVAGFKAYCVVIDANRDATMLTYRETKSLRADQREAIKNMEIETNELIGRCAQACVDGAYFRPINIELFVYQTIMIAHTWALKHWRFKDTTTFDEYVATNLDLLMRSVVTDTGWRAYRAITGEPGGKPAPRSRKAQQSCRA